MNDKRKGTALVTGAAKRIGRAIALELADDGWDLALHFATSRDDADKLASEIRAQGRNAVAVGADLRNEVEVNALVPLAVEAIGAIDCLINNASTFERDTVATSTRETWDLHMEVNLRAPFLLSQAFQAQLPQGRQGCIINIIDQRVWNLTPDFTTYTLSKAGLWGLTQILARAMAPEVRVNGIGPGPTLQSVHQSDEDFAEEWTAMPLARQVLPEDICRAVRFILDSPAVTGQMIAVDSGQHMGIR
ncbi:MAG: SDR family oxidoreductase [Rhodospirillaceae bacterium]|jgi:NAD(P)-dependent dehydrogenase (short-subunit alcohol dehydrogenase family)|nr:SDR family oxidoreductase [Rhodospirillaceae bacterium]